MFHNLVMGKQIPDRKCQFIWVEKDELKSSNGLPEIEDSDSEVNEEMNQRGKIEGRERIRVSSRDGSTAESGSKAGSGRYLENLFKSITYLVILTLLIVIAAIVFSGIEGYNEKAEGYMKLEQQLEFNLKAERILCTKFNLSSGCFVEYPHVRARFQRNYAALMHAAEVKCKLASLKLHSWNSMSREESVMYAISIVSTVGWGVHHPPADSTVLKALTILYALIGLPLYAGLLGYAHEGVLILELTIMRKKWVQKNIGSTKLLGLIAVIVLSLFVLVLGAVCVALQHEERGTDKEELLLQLHTGEAVSENTWSLLTGIYYVFTTITCIGFGDVYVWDPHSVFMLLKPLTLLITTTLIIALLAHAFKCAKRQVEKGFDGLVEGYTERNIAKQSVKYERKVLSRQATRITFHRPGTPKIER